jgi:hypothetical protein
LKRASAIANVGFCKLKLKRFGGLDLLREALDAGHKWGTSTDWAEPAISPCSKPLRFTPILRS